MKTLLIDPDPEILGTISFAFNFTFPHLRVVVVEEGAKGLLKAQKEFPDLIITETDLPDMDGFEIVRQLRLASDVPIIMISARRSEETDIAKGLELGADDYIVKPLSPLSLLARTRAVMRRAGYHLDSSSTSSFVSEHLVVNFSTGEVTVDGQPVHLTPTEYRLLFQLVRNAGKLVNIQLLRELVWGDVDFLEPSAVRKCISQLRRKLGDDPDNPHIILNERGSGYKILKGRARQDIFQG